MRPPLFADLTSYRDRLQWFPGIRYAPDPHKVAICIEQKCRPYPLKCHFDRAVAVKSNRWPSDLVRGYRQSELAWFEVEKSDSLVATVKCRHYCEMEFESRIVRCHSRWFREEEFISEEFISLHVKKAVFQLSSLHFVLERRASREKKSMKLHLNPLERSRKQWSEGKKFSFCITFKFRSLLASLKPQYNSLT